MVGIVVDSCCDLTREIIEKYNVAVVPFKMTIESKEYVDDENLDLEAFLTNMQASKKGVVTSCPSPLEYKEAILSRNTDEVFVITITSKLSGSYNSAMVAKQMVEEENKNIKVHVIDSLAAGAGEIALFLKLVELREGLTFEEIVEKMETLRNSMKIFFILDKFDNLVKNGRMGKVTGIMAGALNIRPIMHGVNGEIEVFQINRGFKKSLVNLAKNIGEMFDDLGERLIITVGVGSEDRSEFLREKLEEMYNFKNYHYLTANGLTSTYANVGGVIVAVI